MSDWERDSGRDGLDKELGKPCPNCGHALYKHRVPGNKCDACVCVYPTPAKARTLLELDEALFIPSSEPADGEEASVAQNCPICGSSRLSAKEFESVGRALAARDDGRAGDQPKDLASHRVRPNVRRKGRPLITLHPHPLDTQDSRNFWEVWKFHLHSTGTSVIEIPEHAQLLHVATQDSRPTVWALVRTKNPIERRRILVTGSGCPMEALPATYIGTAHVGPYVWHVFDEGRA